MRKAVNIICGILAEVCALADAIQEQMIYQALCREVTTRGKWIER